MNNRREGEKQIESKHSEMVEEAKKRDQAQGKKGEESCPGPEGKSTQQGVLPQNGYGEWNRLWEGRWKL